MSWESSAKLAPLVLTPAAVLQRTRDRHHCVIAQLMASPKRCMETLRMYQEELAVIDRAIEHLIDAVEA
jgi:hypothetical protein